MKLVRVLFACTLACVALESAAQPVAESCWSPEPLRFPPGEKEDVIHRTLDFLIESESVPLHPYWPKGVSGITIGVGWDLGQHSAGELEATWSKLPQADIDRLRPAARKTGSAASALLPQLKTVSIPRDIALDVLAVGVRGTYFPATARAFPGFELLPTGAQVALISVVFNRGAAMGRDPNWLKAMEVDQRWEMRRFRDDVQRRDMYAIYAHLGTMKRLWQTGNQTGLVTRRRDEQKLIRPYALQELRWEEKRDALKAKGLPPCITR